MRIDRNEVTTAFEILLKELDQVAELVHEEGAHAFRCGSYDRAKLAAEIGHKLVEFRGKVKALQKEWSTGFASLTARGLPKSRQITRGRLSRGLRTPEDAFRRPILEALVELGGSARVAEVLARIEKKMASQLTKHDLEPLPSNAHCPRWRNTAQWCRAKLVEEGLIRRNSPHGVWEISEAGRGWLQRNPRG